MSAEARQKCFNAEAESQRQSDQAARAAAETHAASEAQVAADDERAAERRAREEHDRQIAAQAAQDQSKAWLEQRSDRAEAEDRQEEQDRLKALIERRAAEADAAAEKQRALATAFDARVAENELAIGLAQDELRATQGKVRQLEWLLGFVTLAGIVGLGLMQRRVTRLAFQQPSRRLDAPRLAPPPAA